MQSIDLDELLDRATRAARRRTPDAELRGLRRLEGGVSSLTFASTLVGDREDRPVVLKVAPAGLAPVRNRDVLRQARVLRALGRLPGFPVPDVLFEDAGDPPDVPPLFAMSLAPGESYEPLLDVSDAPPTPADVAERVRVAARALATLQSVPPRRIGLGAEPPAAVDDELERWRRLFETVDADIAPGHERLYARLAERVPAGIEPRLLHGDYRLANMLFEGPRLAAVIDWEIWSVGDPRSDLAWLLMHLAPAHVFHEDRPAADRAAGSLLPTRDQLWDEYAGARRALGAADHELAATAADLDWFLGVCCYKTASTIAVIWKRERKLASPDPKLVTAARHLHEVLAAGHAVLDRTSTTTLPTAVRSSSAASASAARSSG
ncbi:phosphotransferase family protein [Nocardioides nitrophenolicus]|uniref:phosphotransferase family protein n=1 Tax=Nocardioides nitrophenolicus TaxID=60489 RepID=UPI001959A90E|nr:phosphotransferase family protein [Nocardioides nitrophenolicus]MBM7517188.1 aminoglycoside phosphotransferase (APT) family kinase protein [Nocardioides nitrophenolicus]